MDSLTSLIAGARRRSIANLLLEQACTGLCAALAGFLVLLLVGSDTLNWLWLVALFGGGAAWSAWRTLRGLPGFYGVAQQIDQRLGLSDTLSTAFAFRDRPAQADENVWRGQQQEALRLSSGILPNQAAPWRKPRYWAILAGLVVAAAAGFVARYGFLGTMDLRAPAVQALNDLFQREPEREAASKKGSKGGARSPLEQGEEQGPEGQEELQAEGDAPPELEGDTGDENAQAGMQNRDKLGDPKAGDEQREQEAGDADQEGEQRAGDQDQNAPNQADSNPPQSGEEQAGNENSGDDDPSLFDKMRDAMANLMNKLQSPSQSAQKGPQKAGQKKGDQQQKMEPGEGQEGEQSAGGDAEGDREQAQSDMAQNQGAGQEGGQRSDSDAPKSGFGNQEGSKDIQMAQEQQEAMGKLSEILGQRSKTVKGEVLIELKSSKQQELRTAFQNSTAAHTSAGGEIHRDEIPLEMQRYVENYFEEVRRADASEGQPAAEAVN